MTEKPDYNELESTYLAMKNQVDPDCEPSLGVVQLPLLAKWMAHDTGKSPEECEAYLRAHLVFDEDLGLGVVDVDIGGTWT